MHILILGGNGRAGHHAISSALSRGHTVTALVRDPKTLTPQPNLIIKKGTPTSLASLRTAFITDASTQTKMSTLGPIEAVISCLCTPSSPQPATTAKTPPFLVLCAQNVLAVMAEFRVSKYVAISAAGAAESYPYTGLLSHLMLHATNLTQGYAEHEAVEALLRKEEIITSANGGRSLRWVAVRSVLMTDGANMPVRDWGENGKGMHNEITRASLGEFLVGAVESRRWDGSTPVVSN